MTQMYSAGVQKVTTAAAGPIATLVTPSGSRPDIREIGIFVSSAAASTILLGRPAAAGAGTPTGALGQALDAGDPASGCTLATSFATTQPTAPSVPFHRISLPGVIGAGYVWSFAPNEFNVPVSSNLVIWQASVVAVTFDLYVKWEE